MLIRAILTYSALAASLGANAWLLAERAGEGDRTEQACKLAAAEASVTALEGRTGVLEWLVQQTAADQERTFKRLNAVADRASARQERWDAANLPKPDCGPGQAYIDATNATLGHEQ